MRNIPTASVAACALIAGLAVASTRAKAADATSPQCPPVQHWDPVMQMCMPSSKPSNRNSIDGTPSRHRETLTPATGSAEMPPVGSSPPPNQTLPGSGMTMPMPGDVQSTSAIMFQLNQFVAYSNTSGPRGQSRLTGPGMWMLMYDKDLSPTNHLRIDVMGSPEQLTVGDKGTPQLLHRNTSMLCMPMTPSWLSNSGMSSRSAQTISRS